MNAIATNTTTSFFMLDLLFAHFLVDS